MSRLVECKRSLCVCSDFAQYFKLASFVMQSIASAVGSTEVQQTDLVVLSNCVSARQMGSTSCCCCCNDQSHALLPVLGLVHVPDFAAPSAAKA